MIDGKTADRELQTYIRPQTFPVAIRMLKAGEPIPDKAKRPARDFKKLSMNCQVIDMARVAGRRGAKTFHTPSREATRGARSRNAWDAGRLRRFPRA